jgi:drug/metabolite transporter (DMT)-like permease
VSTLNLYLIAISIWGSTWLAIKFQLGEVAPETSVLYRFLSASILLFAFCKLRGLNLAFTRRQHARLALQGMLMFSVGYIMVYHAELYLVSGLVALCHSLSPLLNMLGVRIAYGTPFSLRVTLGALLGIVGIVLVFWPEITALSAGSNIALGFGYTMMAVLTSAVASTLVSRNGHHSLPVWQSMAWGMLYGAGCSLVITLISGNSLTIAWTLPYVGSLLYLAVFGSVLAFAAYYTLLGRIGAARSGYIGVMVPVIALIVSSVFEGFRWQLATFVGAGLSLIGNLIVMSQQTRKTFSNYSGKFPS